MATKHNFGTLITSVHPVELNLSFEREYDMFTGRGIRLQSTESYRKSVKVEDGLQSSFFGTDFSDEMSYAERYRCECGRTMGKMYEGEICPYCATPVGYVPVDMSRMGWIIMDHFQVISPIFAVKLSDALGTAEGEKVLTRILTVSYGDEQSDDNAYLRREKDKELKKKHPFIGMGMTWLVDHIDEVLDFYEQKKASKKKLFNEMRNAVKNGSFFTDSIPVISAVLRSETPGEKDRKLYKMKINTIYTAMIRTANNINDIGAPENMDEVEKITVDRYLCTMHKEVLQLFDEVFKILNGKTGVIASRVISGRYNFSARNIISASSGELRANEIDMCYLDFLELYRYEIINLYCKLNDCTIQEAQAKWSQATLHFDPVIYSCIEYMLEHNQEDIGVLINRNPSINYGSFLYVKIHKVIPDINNKSMRLNTRVIKTMGADFDGDQLNIYRVIGRGFNKKFARTYDPRYNLYISRINGRVNRDMMPLKDEIVGFWHFNSCD